MTTSSSSNYSDDYDLTPCAYCSRTFAYDVLQRHEDICSRLRRNENHRIRETKSNIKFEIQQKEKNPFKLTELMEKKKKRRKYWRRDHERFINNILQLKSLHRRNRSKDSVNGDRVQRYELDLEEIKRKFYERAMVNIYGDEIENSSILFKKRNTDDISRHSDVSTDEPTNRKSNSHRRSRRFSTNSLQKTSSVPDLIGNQKNYANSRQPISTFEDPYKLNFLDDLFEISQHKSEKHKGSTNQIPPKSDSRKRSKQRTRSNLEINKKELGILPQNNLPRPHKHSRDPSLDHLNLTSAMKTYHPEMNDKTKSYLQQITKVMDYYHKNVWSPARKQPGQHPDTNTSNQADVTSRSDIPSNLSIHKKRLETFKLRNKQNQQQCQQPKNGHSDSYDVPPRFSNDQLMFEDGKQSRTTIHNNQDKEPREYQNNRRTENERNLDSYQYPIMQEARRIYDEKDDIADRLYDGSKYNRFKEHHLKLNESKMNKTNCCSNCTYEVNERNENHTFSNDNNPSNMRNAVLQSCPSNSKEIPDNSQFRKNHISSNNKYTEREDNYLENRFNEYSNHPKERSNVNNHISSNNKYTEREDNYPENRFNEYSNYPKERPSVKFNLAEEHESNISKPYDNRPINSRPCNCCDTEEYSKQQPEVYKMNNSEPQFETNNRQTGPRNYSDIWKESNEQSRIKPLYNLNFENKPNGILKNSNYQLPPVAPSTQKIIITAKTPGNKEINKPVSTQPANPDPCGAFGDDAYKRAWTWQGGEN